MTDSLFISDVEHLDETRPWRHHSEFAIGFFDRGLKRHVGWTLDFYNIRDHCTVSFPEGWAMYISLVTHSIKSLVFARQIKNFDEN